ncbi:disease resistance protein RPM1-like [Camellia sinensis]|uniref:disease resistance protein RPM1-like n=1 Tax=Camellia sinensis TaxID=4442 RepID=UPI001035AD1B|nr:disease resistance protein RPM1-like [Camellia sinensis]
MVAICGLLSAKDKSSVAKWEKTYQSLGAELEGNNQLLSMKKILSLSYINLPHYLKLFFLYLSVFPEDHLIEHWRLSWLWIAEGFVEEKREAPIEQVAEGYLNELINRSLIQVAKINELKQTMAVAFVPRKIGKLTQLKSLGIIKWSKLKDVGPLQYLQGLPNLVYLDLVEAYEEEELCFQAGGLWKLKILLLSGLEGLGWMIVEEGAMPRLEELYIQNCKFMEELPSCIEQLTNLTLLD